MFALCPQAKHAKDEHDAAEDARINAAVAEADRKAQEAAEKLAAKQRAMQQECDKVSQHWPYVYNHAATQWNSTMNGNVAVVHIDSITVCAIHLRNTKKQTRLLHVGDGRP